jgi:hypothetical protein
LFFFLFFCSSSLHFCLPCTEHDLRKLRSIFQSYDIEARNCIIIDRLDDIWLDLGYAGRAPEALKHRLLTLSAAEGVESRFFSENAFIGEFFKPDFNPAVRLAPGSHSVSRNYRTPDVPRPTSASHAASSLRRPIHQDSLQSMPSFDSHVLKSEVDDLKKDLQQRDAEILYLNKQLVLATTRVNATIQESDEALQKVEEKLVAEQVCRLLHTTQSA